jgi:hypothetical protein
MEFARYNGNGMHFLKKKSKAWEKINLTLYVDNKYACAKSIFMGCNKAITSKFDFQTHTQVCVVANCNVSGACRAFRFVPGSPEF